MKAPMFVALSLLLGPVGHCELPVESATLLRKLQEFETAELARADQAIREKRESVAKVLQAQMEAETRKGNLDGAVEIRNAIANLQSKAGAEATTPPTTPTGAGSPPGTTPNIPKDAFKGRKSYYLLVSHGKPLSWSAAQAECENLGGRLACAEDTKDIIKYFGSLDEKLKPARQIWVGGQKSAKDNKVYWTAGAPVDPDRFRWEGNKERLAKDEFTCTTMSLTCDLFLEPEGGFDRYSAFLCEWPR
jgi:hypothetical protein